MGVEELWLGLATVGTFTVPPSLSTTIDGVVGRSRNGNVGSRESNKRAIPFLVAEGSFATEDDLNSKSVTDLISSWSESCFPTLAPS